MNNRISSFDFGRFFFSICVVFIHIPFAHSSAFMPIFRCAVPFFYMLTGYFLASDNLSEYIDKKRIKKSMRSYGGDCPKTIAT